MRIHRITRALALAALCAGTAAIAGDQQLAANGFSPAKMAAALEATMKPEVVAFSYTIAKDGKVVRENGEGPARIAIDGYLPHGPMQRNNIASVTKTFTAVAILQLIEANKSKGVTVNTPIGAYLPDGWKAGPNVANLSFATVLRHRTGFDTDNNNVLSALGYDAIKAMVAAGTTPLPASSPDGYDNANFALLRELLPKLWAATGTLKLEKIDGKGFWNTQGDYNAFVYLKYVNMKIFAPLGIVDVHCFDSGNAATLYYLPKPDPKVNGVPGVDQSRFCGSGGMFLSTNEMTKFLVYLFNTEQLLPKDVREEMVARRLGIDPKSTSRGTSWSHGGIVAQGYNKQGKAGTKACMMHFPDGVDASLVQNSSDDAHISPCNVLVSAFEAGWK
jgi:CubicO group peptidase (beta-lactamase class C family)